jgi:hypothetical protein
VDKPVNTIEIERMRSIIGNKVIVLSNSKPYVSVGIVKSFQAVSQSSNLLPIIEFETGIEFLCLGIVFPYDPDFCDMLASMGEKAFPWWQKVVYLREYMTRLHSRQDWEDNKW